MAVNLTNADKALKTFYLDAVSEQLNKATNPFLAQIKQSTEDVWGKEVRKLAIYGLNGGVGSGMEDGILPSAGGNNYGQFVSTLKNLYGTIEISDKAVRASENNSGAFVNLLNAEMEGLVNASVFNLGRMLFGDGTGRVATVSGVSGANINLDTTKNIVEGMKVDVYNGETECAYDGLCGVTVKTVDREKNRITVNASEDYVAEVLAGSFITVQNSYCNEITGLKALFSKDIDTIYGLQKSKNSWLNPYVKENIGEIDELTLQTAIDAIEERSGSKVNYIVCSWGVRRALQKALSLQNVRMNSVVLEGGFKAIEYNGIPVIADRFCPEGTMYLLNTNDFALHQLCDWEWLAGDDGRVLKQVPGKPVYTATLVKYAELLCSKPCGQGMLSGITEA